MTRLQLHLIRWSACTRCPLCHDRRSVVLLRGVVPCDVLFIGEAPGESEDIFGQPFVGPAGHLLDDIIAAAMPLDPAADALGAPDPQLFSCAFTNLISCIPREDDGTKLREPPIEAVEACQERLAEFVEIARPKLVVRVGDHAQTWVLSAAEGAARAKWHDNELRLPEGVKVVDIVHPAAILRAPTVQKTLLIRRAEVTLANALEALADPGRRVLTRGVQR